MPDPVKKDHPVFTSLAPHAWWVLLIVSLATLSLATQRRIDRVEATTNLPTWSAEKPQPDPASPTGFENGQRTLIIAGHHNPSFSWITEAQIAAHQGKPRLREIEYDTATESRSIQRTAPYRLWLITIGLLHSSFQGENLGYSIERGTLFADPLLLGIILVFGSLYSFRYLGSFAASGFGLGGIFVFPLNANFQPGAPDPHSLAWAFAIGSILPLLVALLAGGKSRRSHFVLAGIFGGMGFWNDAETQAPLLLAIFIGAIAYELIRSSESVEQPSLTKSSWRTWAATGAITTAAASFFEFGPDSFTWSLDAVNPLYSLIWWGFAEIIVATGVWLKASQVKPNWKAVVLLVAGGLAAASWPMAASISDTGSLLASDFYARELANHPQGGFAPNLGIWLDLTESSAAKWATLSPCLILMFLGVRTLSGKIDREERGILTFILLAALFVCVLACYQLRWWNLVDIFALSALTVLFAVARSKNFNTRLRAIGSALLLLPGLFVAFPASFDGEAPELSALEKQALVERDFAYWLNNRQESEPPVLFSTPIFSSAASYYGGFPVVVSSDDENQNGIQTAIRLASAKSKQEISVLLGSNRVTHIALPQWDPTMEQFVRIGARVPPGENLPTAAFTVALRNWDLPLTIRPLNYPAPPDNDFNSFQISSFAVQAEQAPDLALSRLADIFVENGKLSEAESIRKVLKSFPRSVFALGAVANIDHALQEKENLKQTLETLFPYLSGLSAKNLPADRRVSLAILFARTSHLDLATDQVTACFETLDAKTLKTLTPNSVAALLALSRDLDIPFPSADLRALAFLLIPLDLRLKLSQ